MKKSAVKTFGQLRRYAQERALRSARRNDPIAWAYWQETASFAGIHQSIEFTLPELVTQIGIQIGLVKQHAKDGFSLEAAYAYSRAKWFVILGRNNGFVMSPKLLGVNLKWLRKWMEIAA